MSPGSRCRFEPEDRLPAWPRGWYTVARGRDLPRGGRLARRLAGQEIVLFRAASGRAHAIAAHCPHMGAHLRHGEVVGERLRCAMHHWSFAGGGDISTAAGRPCGQTRAWPLVERYGLLFLGLGVDPADPPVLPSPDEPERYAWRSGGPLAVATTWQTLMVSGFDMQHLSAVHQRELQGPPRVETLADGRLRLTYVSKVRGGNIADRLMGWLGRDGIEVQMTCSGPIFVVESRIGRRRTSAILGLLPTAQGVDAYGSFGISRRSWLLGLQLRLTAWLFIAFLRKDFAIIEGMRLETDVQDVGVRAMAAFLAGLPQVPEVAATPAAMPILGTTLEPELAEQVHG